MVNLTLVGANSAGLMYDDELGNHYVVVNYISGIIRKCDTCYFYGTTVFFDQCPTAGNCFVSADEVCNICEGLSDGSCGSCADAHVLLDEKCSPICKEEVLNCYYCATPTTCEMCNEGYYLDTSCNKCPVSLSNCVGCSDANTCTSCV